MLLGWKVDVRRSLLTVLALLAPAVAHATPFESLSHGAIADVSVGTTPVGDLLMGELGVQSLGVMTSQDGRFLHQWQGFLAVKGGELAAAHPYTPLLGGRAKALLESGYRFAAEQPWSPYAGVRLGGDVQVLLPFTVAPNQLNTVNNIDGVGDVNVSGLVRLAGGESYIAGDRALLLSGFVQGWARAAEANQPSAGFIDLGLAARYDVARSLALSMEALWGTTPGKTNAALALTDVTTHAQVEFDCRKVFANGMWLSGAVSYSTQADTLRYPSMTYNARTAPTIGLTVLYGFALGKQEWP